MEIRAPGDEDREGIARIWTTVLGETVTAETLRVWSQRTPEQPRLRRVARVGGAVVGFAGAVVLDRVCWFRVVVDPNARRRGIGSALLRAVEDHARAAHVERLRTSTLEDEGEAFASSRGFHVERRVVKWVLEPTEAELVPCELPIVSLQELGDLEALHRATLRVYEPSPDEQRWDLEDFRTRLVGEGCRHAGLQMAAIAEGEIVGVALLEPIPGTHAARNDLTAIDTRWRRRGIAKAMKSRQIVAAKAARIELLETSNDASNTAALAMNASLGYRRLAVVRELSRPVGGM